MYLKLSVSSSLTLVKYRLKFYQMLMRDKLLQYKHMIIIILALLLPTLANLQDFLYWIINPILAPDANYLRTFSLLIAWQLIFYAWAMIQKKAILGGESRSFLRTLAISSRQRLSIDLQVLMLADLLLFLPFLLVFFQLGHDFLLLTLLRLVSVLLVMLAVQINALLQKYEVVIGVLLVDCLLGLPCGQELSLLLLPITIVFGGWLILGKPIIGLSSDQGEFRKIKTPNFLSTRLSISAKIQGKILFSQHKMVTFSRILMILAIYLISSGIMFSQKNDVSMIMALDFSLTSLIFSGFFPLLLENHQPYQAYFSTVSRGKNFWKVRDLYFISSLSILSSMIFGLSMGIIFDITWLQLLTMLLLQLPLMTSLFFIRRQLARQGAIAALSLSIIWTVLLSCWV